MVQMDSHARQLRLKHLDPVNARRLTRTNEVIAKCEDALIEARQAQLDLIQRLLDDGWTQAVIARALDINRATLNQKIKAAGLDVRPSPRAAAARRQRRGSKASTP